MHAKCIKLLEFTLGSLPSGCQRCQSVTSLGVFAVMGFSKCTLCTVALPWFVECKSDVSTLIYNCSAFQGPYLALTSTQPINQSTLARTEPNSNPVLFSMSVDELTTSTLPKECANTFHLINSKSQKRLLQPIQQLKLNKSC